MSLSSFCIEQRERETQRLKSFLAFSLMGSALLHGALLILGATIPWEQVWESEVEPIEFTLVEPTEPEEKQEKDEKKEEEPQLEVTADSSGIRTLLSSIGNGSSDMSLSAELPRQERSSPLPKPLQNVPPTQSPVTTATARLENSVESIIDRIRNLGRQSPSSSEEESKVAANSSSNTQGEPQALGNFRSNAPVPRGSNRGNSNLSSEGSRNTDAGDIGTIAAREASNDRSSATNTLRDRGTLPKPGRETTIAAVPRNRKPEMPVVEESGSDSRGSDFRGYTQPKYPSRARRRGIEGDTRVTFDVDENGRAVNVRVARSSGNEELDRAVVEEAKRRWHDPSARGRRDVSATVAFEIEGSQRQGQNRERRRQREEAQRNREAADTAARETEAPSPRRRTLSATNGNIPVATRRRTQPRSRQAPSQSESAAAPRRRQQAVAPTPRRRQQAVAPTPRRRQQAVAPTPRRRQQAVAPTPRRRQAAAPTPRRRQQAVAPTPRTRRRQAAAPAPRTRQQAVPRPRLRQAAPAPRSRQNAPAPGAAGSGSSNQQ